VAATVPPLRAAIRGFSPGLSVETAAWEAGSDVVVGMDEVGRGAWAGPISVGAAVLPRGRRLYKVRDSKLLTEEEREALFGRIALWCRAWAVGHASARECDDLGMSAAQRLAASRAQAGLGLAPDAILVDGSWDFAGGATTIVAGDRTCLSIAAASVLAKVTRDRIMRREAAHYPAYGFDANKGYPAPQHRAALHWLGPSSIHRRSWVFMDSLVWGGVPRARRAERQMGLFDGGREGPGSGGQAFPENGLDRSRVIGGYGGLHKAAQVEEQPDGLVRPTGVEMGPVPWIGGAPDTASPREDSHLEALHRAD
jgi:ribonuclease HII